MFAHSPTGFPFPLQSQMPLKFLGGTCSSPGNQMWLASALWVGGPYLNPSASPHFLSSAYCLWLLGNNRNHLKPVWGTEGGPSTRWVSVCQGVCMCVWGVSACIRGPHHTCRTEHISISPGSACLLPSSQSASGASAKPQERLAASSQASRAARTSGSRHHLSSARSHSGDLSRHQLVLLSSISREGSEAQRG